MHVAHGAEGARYWNIDRINQRTLPLDLNLQTGPWTGDNIDLYIVDTGVRYSHENFSNRARLGVDMESETGSNVVTPEGSDCNGHGTHVAGIAAGTVTGVATGAHIVSVRVLDCNGDGDVPSTVSALKWIIANHRSGRLAVVNLSLGVDLGDDGSAVDAAVATLARDGVVVVVAAGNGDSHGRPMDACSLAPSDQPTAITVGATTISDAVAWYSNYGRCVSLYAPGGDAGNPITSSWKDGDTDYATDVGTSMASPLVAGYAALLAQSQPDLCVDQIKNAIVSRATPNVVTGLTADSPNKLLYLDTSVITDKEVPGQPTALMATSDDRSLVVSWDPPCDGGDPISGYVVQAWVKGHAVRTVTVPGTATAARLPGLVNGMRYQVSVTPFNSIGTGFSTARMSTAVVRGLHRGLTVAASSLVREIGGRLVMWKVDPSSKNVCKVQYMPQQLKVLKRGTCKVSLTAQDASVSVVRNFKVS